MKKWLNHAKEYAVMGANNSHQKLSVNNARRKKKNTKLVPTKCQALVAGLLC
jgi:hypothetical protein